MKIPELLVPENALNVRFGYRFNKCSILFIESKKKIGYLLLLGTYCVSILIKNIVAGMSFVLNEDESF